MKAELITEYSSEFKDFLEVSQDDPVTIYSDDYFCSNELRAELIHAGLYGKNWCHFVEAKSDYLACGVGLKTYAYHKDEKADNTAVNAIRFVFCHRNNWNVYYVQRLNEGFFWDWGVNEKCPQDSYISKIALYQQRYKLYEAGDDVGTMGLAFECRSKKGELKRSFLMKPYQDSSFDNNFRLEGLEMDDSKFVCGGQVKLEQKLRDYDDTALNGLAVKFCPR